MKLWCNVCDIVIVNSKDKNSGIIYEAYGHIINYKKRTLEDAETIVFALCSSCKLKDTVQPTDFEEGNELTEILDTADCRGQVWTWVSKMNRWYKEKTSKATNIFAVTRERRAKELQAALFKACEHITTKCSLCPLNQTDTCAKEQMPPAAFDKQGNIDRTICQDWLTLHFMKKE